MKSLLLDGQIILVTGGSGHLGQAICYQLGAAGAHVIVNGRTDSRLRSVADAIRSNGGAASPLVADVTREAEQRHVADHVARVFGRLNGLVNNAYAGQTGTINSSTGDEIRNTLESSLVAPFGLTRALIPLLEKAESKSVVNVASMYGMVSPDDRIYGESCRNSPPFYGAGKAGLIQLTRYLACHLASKNIRVNAISPGPFPPQSIRIDDPEFHARLAAKVPMGRVGLADEIGGAVQFLLSESASFITGVNIPIDGGWTAGSN